MNFSKHEAAKKAEIIECQGTPAYTQPSVYVDDFEENIRFQRDFFPISQRMRKNILLKIPSGPPPGITLQKKFAQNKYE